MSPIRGFSMSRDSRTSAEPYLSWTIACMCGFSLSGRLTVYAISYTLYTVRAVADYCQPPISSAIRPLKLGPLSLNTTRSRANGHRRGIGSSTATPPQQGASPARCDRLQRTRAGSRPSPCAPSPRSSRSRPWRCTDTWPTRTTSSTPWSTPSSRRSACPRAAATGRPPCAGRRVSVREALSRHRWAIGLMESRRSPGPANLRHHDAVIGRLRAAGFSLGMTADAYSLLNSYVYGFALTAMNLPFETTAEVASLTRDLLGRLPSTSTPTTPSSSPNTP